MAKPATFPAFFDDATQITTADLKRLGYLRPGDTVCSPLSWECDGQLHGSLQVTASVDERFVDLDYDQHNRPISYRVLLESVARHFGGREWYFICPETGRRCRKLYLIGERFLSRYAYPSAMYRQQAANKSDRSLHAAMKAIDLQSNFFGRRYVRTAYRGKPTKGFCRFLDQRKRLGIKLSVVDLRSADD